MSRTEEKLLRKKEKMRRLKNIWLLVLCFILFLSMLYIADVRTSELVSKKDGSHAFLLNIENSGYLRIDIAGETYRFNIENLIIFAKQILERLKEAFRFIMDTLGS